MVLFACLMLFVFNAYSAAEEKGGFKGLQSRSLPDITKAHDSESDSFPIPQTTKISPVMSTSKDRGVQMFNLGFGYVKKGDTHNAKKWFLEAAGYNETRAMNYLGIYSLREGHEHKAKLWFDQGTKLGDVISKYNLASLYHQKGDFAQEIGKVEKSQKCIAKAVKLYSEIVASYPAAKNNLAVILYEQGDDDQALKLWQEAKAEGYSSAIFNVAWVADGRGDNETAKKGYEQVAKQGDLDGMFYLAKLYEKEGDLLNAKFWYKKAADRGDEDAIAKVKEMGSGSLKRRCKRKLSLIAHY